MTQHLIVGTAGHIDHGKTALVRALTSIDTDRLEEEKRRGISIDLGFAHLKIGELECGFVDVPGHERFVKNMLAGVGGIDLVLLVIAADESIKPQTREHFDICRLLGIRRGIVVLTKADLVDEEILELVKLEVEEFVAGSFLEGAPVVAVSSVTGQGIDELKQQIAQQGRDLAPRDAARHFRLPIDRAFAMKGFGAVVTGTLVSGSLRLEQEVEVYPTGRRARVRGLQVHGRAVERAVAGQRTAVNLGGVDHGDLRRGMTLSEPGLFISTSELDGTLEMLVSAPRLKHRSPVHFHAGTAEVEAQVRLLEQKALEPGRRGYARLKLRQPVLLLPGDRFILRRFSPVVTIAGGVVLDIAPSGRLGRAQQRLRILEQGTPAERVRLLVGEAAMGVSAGALIARTGWTREEVRRAVSAAGCIWVEDHQWAVDAEMFAQAQARLLAELAAFHKQNPLAAGMGKEEARSRVWPHAPAFVFDALLQSTLEVVAEADTLRLATHRIVFKQDEEQALALIEEAFRAAGLAVPSAHEVLKGCGIDAKRARTLLQILLNQKRLVKVSEELVFHADALNTVRAVLASRKGSRFKVPEFKDWTGISRKYAIPLLEFFDRERLTRREGDFRVIL